ncbi:hypothetical protein [Streptomyces regalis]|uniref:Uncharacterized protein n=1 Tax=Streptomyces regalis TaxID=68262 RepID=A0A101JAH7_9ACTN|nr:hypothetical protein [Streptomyces regalis]KUL23205.1 hypothetical protein ADL12_39690 [Streptomyces regalis]
MGATSFYTTANSSDLQTAFQEARMEAAAEHGRGGFSGSIYEKDTFTLIDEPRRPEESAMERAVELVRADDARISDKWGPAGALRITTRLGGEGWLLFGFAPC